MRSQAKMKGYQEGGYAPPARAYGYRPTPGNDWQPQPQPQPRAAVHHKIGPAPSPGMSQNAAAVMRGIMGRETRDWGSAVSKIANAFITRRNDMQMQTADRSLAQAKDERRAGWASALGEGATLRDVAASDPTILEATLNQGRPVAQVGPDGRVVAHPMAPETPGTPALRNFYNPETGDFFHSGNSHDRRRHRPPLRLFLTIRDGPSRKSGPMAESWLIRWRPRPLAPLRFATSIILKRASGVLLLAAPKKLARSPRKGGSLETRRRQARNRTAAPQSISTDGCVISTMNRQFSRTRRSGRNRQRPRTCRHSRISSRWPVS